MAVCSSMIEEKPPVFFARMPSLKNEHQNDRTRDQIFLTARNPKELRTSILDFILRSGYVQEPLTYDFKSSTIFRIFDNYLAAIRSQRNKKAISFNKVRGLLGDSPICLNQNIYLGFASNLLEIPPELWVFSKAWAVFNMAPRFSENIPKDETVTPLDQLEINLRTFKFL